jgi:hypothetical protein
MNLEIDQAENFFIKDYLNKKDGMNSREQRKLKQNLIKDLKLEDEKSA